MAGRTPAKVEGDRLLFGSEQDDGIMRYDFRVDTDGTGLLRMIDVPEVKPFRLRR